jgi:hypothetical protein
MLVAPRAAGRTFMDVNADRFAILTAESELQNL